MTAISATYVTPDLDWNEVRMMDDLSAAVTLDARIRLVDAILHLGFIEVGLITTEVQERQLWRLVDDENGVPFRNFSDWLKKAAPKSYKTCHNAKTVVKELRGDLTENEMSKMSECNLAQMRQVSPEVRRDPEVIKAAQTMEEAAFVNHIIQHHPQQHLEPIVRPTLRVTPEVEAALDMVGRLMQVEDRQGQLEALCIDFLQEHPSHD